jgi:CRP-like cAMP-binding protein
MPASQANAHTYRIWGLDLQPYGPAQLAEVADWIKQQRVLADTWIFSEQTGAWQKAASIPELKDFFYTETTAQAELSAYTVSVLERLAAVKPGFLRRIKIFADLEDRQIEDLVECMEVVTCTPHVYIIRKGEHGDSLFLVLEGEVRARLLLDGQETSVATIGAGGFFGEVSLLDEGPRSADVISNEKCVLLKLSAESFQRLKNTKPELALSFLAGLGKTIVGRLRTITKRYHDSYQLLNSLSPED